MITFIECFIKAFFYLFDEITHFVKDIVEGWGISSPRFIRMMAFCSLVWLGGIISYLWLIVIVFIWLCPASIFTIIIFIVTVIVMAIFLLILALFVWANNRC